MPSPGPTELIIVFGPFIWLGSGVIGFYLMQRRGGSGLLGLVLGILAGPIGVLIILLIGDSAAIIAARQQKLAGRSDADMKACPFCAEDIRAEAILCKHCGSELSGNPKS